VAKKLQKFAEICLVVHPILWPVIINKTIVQPKQN